MRLTTKQHSLYWRERKIAWAEHYWNPEHPHRSLIVDALKKIKFYSVYEIGCGAGANLYRILKEFPTIRVGGIDINKDAIEEAKKHLPSNALLEPRDVVKDGIFMNDKSIDVLISDACLIYIDPFKINNVMKEITRITRNAVVFVELHSSFLLERIKIRRKGYHIYNYKKLLQKHGFYDIEIKKIPKGVWDGTPWESHGYLIIAKI